MSDPSLDLETIRVALTQVADDAAAAHALAALQRMDGFAHEYFLEIKAENARLSGILESMRRIVINDEPFGSTMELLFCGPLREAEADRDSLRVQLAGYRDLVKLHMQNGSTSASGAEPTCNSAVD